MNYAQFESPDFGLLLLRTTGALFAFRVNKYEWQ